MHNIPYCDKLRNPEHMFAQTYAHLYITTYHKICNNLNYGIRNRCSDYENIAIIGTIIPSILQLYYHIIIQLLGRMLGIYRVGVSV